MYLRSSFYNSFTCFSYVTIFYPAINELENPSKENFKKITKSVFMIYTPIYFVMSYMSYKSFGNVITPIETKSV